MWVYVSPELKLLSKSLQIQSPLTPSNFASPNKYQLVQNTKINNQSVTRNEHLGWESRGKADNIPSTVHEFAG